MEDPGCSNILHIAFAAAMIINIMTRLVMTLPCLTFSESARPKGCEGVLKVEPRLLGGKCGKAVFHT